MEVLGALHGKMMKDGRLKGKSGDCYIEMVRYTKEGVKIESINAYGTSARPESKHYTDQMKMFVDREYKQMTFDRKVILENAERKYSPK
jgi:acyl-homoserine-lactone acylase